jgi:hypothetical protein
MMPMEPKSTGYVSLKLELSFGFAQRLRRRLSDNQGWGKKGA